MRLVDKMIVNVIIDYISVRYLYVNSIFENLCKLCWLGETGGDKKDSHTIKQEKVL